MRMRKKEGERENKKETQALYEMLKPYTRHKVSNEKIHYHFYLISFPDIFAVPFRFSNCSGPYAGLIM